jgi:hypothetical protein
MFGFIMLVWFVMFGTIILVCFSNNATLFKNALFDYDFNLYHLFPLCSQHATS